MTATTAFDDQPKPDNLLGICAAIGEDLGFDPLWLRVALAMGILWNPAVVLGTYLALGVLVLATRWLFPDARPAPVEHPALPQAANEETPAPALALARAA